MKLSLLLLSILPKSIESRLRESTKLRMILKNITWLLWDNLIGSVVMVYVSIRVTNYLGPERFGLLNYVLVYVTMFRVVAFMGLEEIAVRELAPGSNRRNEIMGSALFLRGMGALACLFLIIGSIWVLRPNEPEVRTLVTFGSLISVFWVFLLLSRWFDSQLQSKYAVLARNISLFICSGVKLCLIWTGASVGAFVWVFVAQVAITAAFLMVFYARSGEAIRAWRVSWKEVRYLFRDAWPRLLSSVAVSVRLYVGSIMIGQMLGDTELGEYSVAFRFVQFLYFVPGIFTQSLAPALIEAKNISDSLYYRRLTHVYRVLFFLGAGVAVPLCLASKWIVGILFDPEFERAGVLLAVMSVQLFVVYVSQARVWFIVNNGLLRYSLVMSIVESTMSVLLSYILISRFSAYGAIWAFVLSLLIQLLILDSIFKVARPNAKAIVQACLTPWRLLIRR